jgi:hypothetical protein
MRTTPFSCLTKTTTDNFVACCMRLGPTCVHSQESPGNFSKRLEHDNSFPVSRTSCGQPCVSNPAIVSFALQCAAAEAPRSDCDGLRLAGERSFVSFGACSVATEEGATADGSARRSASRTTGAEPARHPTRSAVTINKSAAMPVRLDSSLSAQADANAPFGFGWPIYMNASWHREERYDQKLWIGLS